MPPNFDPPLLASLYHLGEYFRVGDVSRLDAKRELDMLAEHLGHGLKEFQWGEHSMQVQGSETQCQYCGANFLAVFGDLGCSGAE